MAGKRPKRGPDVHPAREHIARWHDANHGISAPANSYRLVDDSCNASEPFSPQLIAQHDERRCAGLVLFVVKDAPDSGLHPQCRQGISRNVYSFELQRITSTGQVIAVPVEDTDVLKDCLLRSPVNEIRV